MHTPISQDQDAGSIPRVEVRCAGIDTPNSTVSSVRQVAQQLLRSESDDVVLAVVHVARLRPGLHRCETQLFGRGLQHVAGHAQRSDSIEAAAQSISRALRALKTNATHNPWTSPHPGCQYGETRAK